MSGVRPRVAVAGLCVLAGSQLGHALVYAVRYGAAAGHYESTGAHAYFPALTSAVGASLGAVLMTGLLVLAAARIALAPPGSRARSTTRYLDVLAAVFTIQLLMFLGQESVEALLSGQAVPSPGDQLLLAVFGQLPAAAIASGAISWLLARIEAAWTVLAEATTDLRLTSVPTLPVAVGQGRPESSLPLLAAAFPSAFRKRGPPRAAAA